MPCAQSGPDAPTARGHAALGQAQACARPHAPFALPPRVLAIIATMPLLAALILAIASTTAFASEPCGTGNYPFPYTDVASVTDPFCPGIMEAYVTGVSKGTSPTTFSPDDPVIRLQMTTFLQRALDQALVRTS